MRTTVRQRLLTSTLLIGATAFAAPAWAQPQDETPENAVTAEEDPDAGEGTESIVVTGSRIQRRDLTSTSPLAVIQDEEFRLSGAVNVEQVINTLPQVIPGTTAFSNNPGGGVATLNLRGLGAQRNLVLVNGRRYVFYDPNQIVDLNTIPQFLIDGVDVVTGGASAVYGSDALAGVINFRLRQDLNGVMAGAQYSITEEGDGRRYNAYVALGTEFADGRGSVTVFGEYFNRGSVFQSDRDFSFFALNDTGTQTGQTARFGEPVPGLSPGGSAGVPQGRFVASSTITVGGTVFPIAQGTNFPGAGAFFGTPGSSTPYAGASDAYNYAPSNYLQVPQERFLLGGYGEYEIADGISAYTEVSFINNRVENELAPTPITQQVNFQLAAIQPLLSAADFAQVTLISQRQLAAVAAAAVPGCGATTANPLATCANPFGPLGTGTPGAIGALQPGQVRLQANTRTTSIGARNVTDDRNAFRVLAGVKGNINENLAYDAYYFYARTRNGSIQEGNVSRSRFTALAANGTCNFFGQDVASQNCVNQISILAQNTVESTLQVAQASVSGPLFTLPTSSDPVAFAVGAEHRSVSAEFIPDTALSSGDVAGFNAGQPTAGGYNVSEFFGEVRVPLLQDTIVERFELNGGFRYSDYSLEAVGGVETYFAGAELAIIPDITFRAQYQRAVRAPNVQELFGGQSVGFPAATDPCSSRTPAAQRTETLRNLCIATGVPAPNVFQAFVQPNDQIQGAFGGNPNLEEEVGDTFTAGVVLRPRFIPRLNITIDYYDIEIDNSIATAGGGVNNILNLCYNTIQDANSAICQLISRDQQGVISGPPFVVSANNANLASLTTSGVDLQVDYNMPLNFSLTGAEQSRLNFFFLGTYTDEYIFTPLVDLPDDFVSCAGKFGLNCGDPTARYKWSTRLSLIDGDVTTTLRWRHINSTRDDDDETDYIVERIRAYDLFDLAFAFNVNDNFTLNMGVNNLLDKDPPVLGSNAEQANTYPGTFDPLGRDFFVSANLRF